MKEIRIRFKKLGRAKYISHLDLTRTMTRAVRRAGIPVWYTEGFNRHPYLTFAAPLSLGFEGLTESMDVRLVEYMPIGELVSRLNHALPEGLSAYTAGEPVMKTGDIASAKYLLTFKGDLSRFDSFLEQERIQAEKKSKKGVIRQLELKPYLKSGVITKQESGIVVFELTLPCGSTENINPMLILTAFADFLGEDETAHPSVFCDVKRLDLLASDGNPFV